MSKKEKPASPEQKKSPAPNIRAKAVVEIEPSPSVILVVVRKESGSVVMVAPVGGKEIVPLISRCCKEGKIQKCSGSAPVVGQSVYTAGSEFVRGLIRLGCDVTPAMEKSIEKLADRPDFLIFNLAVLL